jgi:D-alanyl-D-alanine carboxypeptidase
MMNFKKNLLQIFNIQNRTRYFLWVLFALSVSSIAVFAMMVSDITNKEDSSLGIVEETDFFTNIDLEAKGVIVWDVINHKPFFSKNVDAPLALASLTKIMTAIVANDILPENSKIEILEEYMSPEGDSGLKIGDLWETKDLIDFTLITSSNDGAFALASVAQAANVPLSDRDLEKNFIESMNRMAERIGLSNTKFFNEHGLDREVDRGGAYGSARDMATLFEYTLKRYPHILEATKYKNLSLYSKDISYDATNTNTFVDNIPGLIASKTGFTDLAGGNLLIGFDAGINRPVIISVLGSTQTGRFEDTFKLVEATLKTIREEK